MKIGEKLLITPYHPIKINNEWRFSKDIGETVNINCDYLYNFVLESGHILIINNIPCCTLGH